MNFNILAVFLCILVFIFEYKLIHFNRRLRKLEYKFGEGSKRKLWIYNSSPKIANSGLITLCLKSITKFLGSQYKIIIFTNKDINRLLPEYNKYLSSCKNYNAFINILKFSILYKYGGLWLPNSTIVLNQFSLEERPLTKGRLIFFGNKKQEFNNYYTKYNYSAIASLKNTTQIKKILTYLLGHHNKFCNSENFNKKIDFLINDDNHIHYTPISSNIKTKNLFVTKNEEILYNLKKYNFTILNITEIINNPAYKILIKMTEKELLDSNYIIRHLLQN